MVDLLAPVDYYRGSMKERAVIVNRWIAVGEAVMFGEAVQAGRTPK